MSKEKDVKQQELKQQNNKHIKPGDIEGKIEIPDTRERRDGPGGD